MTTATSGPAPAADSRPALRQAPQAQIPYRPDIDGLRAIAVLAVVGFHATPRFVPGGFVGVDVFFVVSGFLISGIIFRALERGTFSFADFYARRIRRIFPALIVTLIGVAAVGWLVLTGAEFRALQKHLAAGSLFVANIALWQESGYFDTASEAKPLLHLWSLAIEEQFYLVWPPLLYLCWKRRLNVLSLAILIVASSFAVNVATVGVSAPAAFYLATSRIWELLLGAALAYVEEFRKDPVDRAIERVMFASPDAVAPRTVANVKAIAGLVLIAISAAMLSKGLGYPGWWFVSDVLRGVATVFRLDQGQLYPGWWALLPTIGTALLIWAGADAWINRLLAWRPLVYIGLMSYPLYLWHWPLLSFAHITESGHPSRTIKFAAVAASFLLAWLTYEAIERPIRRTVNVRTPWRVIAIAATLAIIGGASLAVWATRAWTSRTPYFVTDAIAMPLIDRRDGTCVARFNVDTEYCEQYARDLPVTTALIGDSHADHFLFALGEALKPHGETVAHLGQSGCPPLLDIVKVGVADTCRTADAAMLDRLTGDAVVRRVVLSFRGVYYVTGVTYGSVEDSRGTFQLAGSTLPADASLRQALTTTIDLLQKARKEVWLIHQVPELGFNPSECVGRPFSFEHHVRTPCAVPRPEVEARQAPYRAIVRDVSAAFPRLHVVDPMTYLCDDQWCHAAMQGTMLYGDSNHLNREGSLFFSDKVTFDR